MLTGADPCCCELQGSSGEVAYEEFDETWEFVTTTVRDAVFSKIGISNTKTRVTLFVLFFASVIVSTFLIIAIKHFSGGDIFSTLVQTTSFVLLGGKLLAVGDPADANTTDFLAQAKSSILALVFPDQAVAFEAAVSKNQAGGLDMTSAQREHILEDNNACHAQHFDTDDDDEPSDAAIGNSYALATAGSGQRHHAGRLSQRVTLSQRPRPKRVSNMM